MPAAKDLTDERFGKLTAIKPTGRSKKGDVLWLCKCDCGEYKRIGSYMLKKSKSCGCLSKEKRFQKTHGLTKSPEHKDV